VANRVAIPECRQDLMHRGRAHGTTAPDGSAASTSSAGARVRRRRAK
jgi:hypothetical protein